MFIVGSVEVGDNTEEALLGLEFDLRVGGEAGLLGKFFDITLLHVSIYKYYKCF